ncbi:MAG: hypothetical protein V3571_15850 [Pseudodesulfovibrio sp.]
MGALLRVMEGALLAGLGAYMVALSRSSVYWQLLNPRYAWLTLAAGALIGALGLAHLANRERRGGIGEVLALALFSGLALAAYAGPDAFSFASSSGDYAPGSLTRTYDDLPEVRPTETLDGRTYIRINLAELLAAEDGGLAGPGDLFAVQGAVLRAPDLDREGYVAVGRLYVFCCFADAVGVVALVKVDDPADYPTGTWVRVLGELREEAVLPGRAPQVPGSLSTARSDRFVIDARAVDETVPEGVPFILEVRPDRPFAY